MAGAAGRLVRGAAALGASLALLGGSAGVVRAEEPVYAIQVEAALRLPPAGSGDQQPFYHADLGRPKGDVPRDYVFTWDFSELAGFVDVGVEPHSGDRCTVDGTRMTCRHRVVDSNPLIPTPRLRAVPGAQDGRSGHLRVTAESEGVTVRGASTLVRVGGAELLAVRVPLKSRPFVGEVQRPRYSFVNDGTLPAGRVLLALTVTRGMDLPRTAGNCEYADLPGPVETGFALCSFEGPFEPGAVYRADRGVEVRTGERAFVDTLKYEFLIDAPAVRERLRAGLVLTRGTGPSAVMREAGSDLPPADRLLDDAEFYEPRARNTTDLQVLGDTAFAAPGERFSVDLGVRNNGPAWITQRGAGDSGSLATVWFTVPAGTKVVSKPDRCQAPSADGKVYRDGLGAPVYTCELAGHVLEDGRYGLRFGLLAEKAVENARGRIELLGGADQFRPDDDADPDNNTASVVVNPAEVAEGTRGVLAFVLGATVVALAGGAFVAVRRRRRAS